jgi:hypothetical protein
MPLYPYTGRRVPESSKAEWLYGGLMLTSERWDL